MQSDDKLPHFRNDADDGLDPQIIKHVDENYLYSLSNLNKPNPKVLVVFSGGNAVGKSALSQKIGEELNGLILENDAIKACLLELKPDLDRDSRNRMTWQYSMSLYRRIDELTRNGLIVRDGIIDWYFDRILPVFEEKQYRIFVIGYDLSREKRIELIKRRGDKATINVEKMIGLLDEHEIHIKRFRESCEPQIMLNDENLFDHDKVIQKLRSFLDQ